MLRACVFIKKDWSILQYIWEAAKKFPCQWLGHLEGGRGVLRVLGLKKASKFDRFQKCQNQKLNFWLFSKYSFRNELHVPFLPYFNKLLAWKKIFTSQGSKKSNDIKELFQVGFVKDILIKGKNLHFFYWVSQKCCVRV